MKKSKQITKKVVFSSLFLLISHSIFAGAGGGSVDAQIDTWAEEIETALNAAIAIFAIVGGFLVFFQYMQGNDQAQKNLIKYVIGLGVFGLSSLIVTTFVP